MGLPVRSAGFELLFGIYRALPSYATLMYTTVPYPLKAPVYERLSGDRRWHPFVFRGLLHSAHDVYGDLDVPAARRLLGRLRLPRDTPHLDDLAAKLADATPKGRRPRDKGRGGLRS